MSAFSLRRHDPDPGQPASFRLRQPGIRANPPALALESWPSLHDTTVQEPAVSGAEPTTVTVTTDPMVEHEELTVQPLVGWWLQWKSRCGKPGAGIRRMSASARAAGIELETRTSAVREPAPRSIRRLMKSRAQRRRTLERGRARAKRFAGQCSVAAEADVKAKDCPLPPGPFDRRRPHRRTLSPIRDHRKDPRRNRRSVFGRRRWRSSPLQTPDRVDEFRDTLARGRFRSNRKFRDDRNLLLRSEPACAFRSRFNCSTCGSRATSRIVDTLIILSMIVRLRDRPTCWRHMRRLILTRVAVVQRLDWRAVLSAAAKAQQNGSSRGSRRLPTCRQLRLFMTGQCLRTMFRAPIAPINCWSSSSFIAILVVHIVTGSGLGASGCCAS